MEKAELLNRMGVLVKTWRSNQGIDGFQTAANDLFDLIVEAQKIPAHEESIYKSMAGFHKLPPLGTQFIVGRTTFEIIGWNYKARKNSVKIKNVLTGKRFVCPPEYVKSGTLLTQGKPV